MASTLRSEKRSNGTSSPTDVPPSSTPSTNPAPSLVFSSTDLLIAAIYPITLIAGSLFSLLSPSPASSASYFSQKHNLFNVIFVKYGWFWTSVVFAIHISRVRTSSKQQALIRWVIATTWWVAVTQWFFGPPLMDRTFMVTGGACAVVENSPKGMSMAKFIVTSGACKLAGGDWEGGHDLSGHVFLLTHASLFLWSEVLPAMSIGGLYGRWETRVVMACLGIWWWMLLMTGIYFHTWREKLTGWIASLLEWAVIYVWALRFQPAARSALGVPGV